MRTLLSDPLPTEVEAMLERRRRLGQDRRDEVWEGVYRMVPAPGHSHSTLAAQVKRRLAPLADNARLEVTDDFNLGDSKNNYCVPDGGLHRPGAAEMWHPTAALVLEVLSPDDDTWEKLPFYAAHHVDEVLIIDSQERKVHWLGLTGQARYEPIEHSRLIELGPAELARQIDWPAAV
jgi:Uma2 family endonuclease